MTGASVERVLRMPRPPQLGSIIARGDDVRLPVYFDFGPAGLIWGNTIATDTAQSQTGALLDLESILRIIGGLIAVLLGASVVGRSRFRGQLHAWQALGVHPAIGVAGKLLGCMTLLVIGSCVTLAVAFAAIAIRFPEEAASVAALLASLLTPTTIYLCVLAAGGAALAVWLPTMSTALLASVGGWCAVAMIGPQIAGVTGPLLSPGVARSEHERARDQVHAEDLRTAEHALGDEVDSVLTGFPDRIPAPALDEAIDKQRPRLESIWMTHVQNTRQTLTNAETQWMNWRVRQMKIEGWSQHLTPGASLVAAATSLAGTGSGLTLAWYRHTAVHQKNLNQALFDNRPMATIRLRGQIAELVRHRTLRWSDLPSPPEIALHPTWQDAVTPLGVLVGYLAAALVCVVAGARRLRSLR